MSISSKSISSNSNSNSNHNSKLTDYKSSISESSIYNYYRFSNKIDNNKKSNQIYFCSNKMCLLIKKTLIKIFPNIKSSNSLIFSFIDLKTLKSQFSSDLLNSYLFEYSIIPKKKYNDVIIKFLKENKNESLTINTKNLVKQKDIVDMVKNHFIINQPEYNKKLKTIIKIDIIYSLNKSKMKYNVICDIKLNIKEEDPIYIINIKKIIAIYPL
jgi:hypothetical protein